MTIELEARRPRELAPLLLLAWGAGGLIAGISLWVANGSGDADERSAMETIAVLALLPALWYSGKAALLRRPSRTRRPSCASASTVANGVGLWHMRARGHGAAMALAGLAVGVTGGVIQY